MTKADKPQAIMTFVWWISCSRRRRVSVILSVLPDEGLRAVRSDFLNVDPDVDFRALSVFADLAAADGCFDFRVLSAAADRPVFADLAAADDRFVFLVLSAAAACFVLPSVLEEVSFVFWFSVISIL